MVKPNADGEKILRALEDLRARLDDLFILEASKAGIGGHQIRAILGIDMARVNRIAKHVKKGQ